jgi:hypothetical protein
MAAARKSVVASNSFPVNSRDHVEKHDRGFGYNRGLRRILVKTRKPTAKVQSSESFD